MELVRVHLFGGPLDGETLELVVIGPRGETKPVLTGYRGDVGTFHYERTPERDHAGRPIYRHVPSQAQAPSPHT